MKPFRAISMIAFCLLVVFSSSSFIIGIHMCSGNIQDIALFTKAQTCANEKKMLPCHKQESKPCCEDESVLHEAQEIKSDVSKVQLSIVPALGIDQPVVLVAEIIPSSSLAKIRFYNYDSPIRWTDITVEYQVFLI